MENASLVITVETLTRIVFPLLYLLAATAVYRWFVTHLSPLAKWLAGLMLLAQILAIGNALYIDSSSSFYNWLWDLHSEWNITATLASTQLVVVGGVALLTAWLARSNRAWYRLYLTGIGLVFLFLASDEYFTLHEYRISWRYYVQLGAAVVAATSVTALLSPRRLMRWHVCLLAGLAISALGAIHIEQFGTFCGEYGIVHISNCPRSTVWALEEIFEFLGIWLTLIAILGQFSQVVETPIRVERAVILIPTLWIIVLVPNAQIWPVARQVGGIPGPVVYESGTELHAYRLHLTDSDLTVRLFIAPERWDYNGLGYSVDVVDQISGNTIVNRNTHAHRRLEFYLAPGYEPVYRQWARLDFPPLTPVNRAFRIVLTLWHKKNEHVVFQRVRSSKLGLLGDAQVTLGEFVIPSESDTSAAEPLALFDIGFALDPFTLPETARAGETLSIEFTWRSDTPGSEDHIQFLHLGHAESGEWFVYDQQPLGERLPTRLWYSGLADSEVWSVPLPADLAPGRYDVFTGLYRSRDNQRVPTTDADGAPWLDNRVAIGSLTVE